MPITNEQMQGHEFLAGMYRDDYFPDFLVDKGKQILVRLCERIETQKPVGESVLELTHAATEEFNELQEEFWENDSELETVARECIADDFGTILDAYGYEVDLEDAIAPRDW